MNGVHVVLAKKPDVIMDSATVGIPRDSPDGYYEHVKWDTRISNSGEFVHAAPWSVGDQGRLNVSHGCINVSNAEAKWFYGFSQRGDIVKVVGSSRGPLSWDAGTEDWNMSWAHWTSS
jgi:lipoprotein-anchoring transpeptidase ErfK/SrfK